MGYIAIKHAFIYPLSVNYIPDDNNYAIHPLPLSPLISPSLFSHPLEQRWDIYWAVLISWTRPHDEYRVQTFSKYPPCYKDIAFWLPEENFNENDFHEVVWSSAGDLVEKVELIDKFVHPKTERVSHCYRITYRSMDRNVTNKESNIIQDQIREMVVNELGVENYDNLISSIIIYRMV